MCGTVVLRCHRLGGVALEHVGPKRNLRTVRATGPSLLRVLGDALCKVGGSSLGALRVFDGLFCECVCVYVRKFSWHGRAEKEDGAVRPVSCLVASDVRPAPQELSSLYNALRLIWHAATAHPDGLHAAYD